MVTHHTASPITANARARSPARTRGSRSVVSLIAVMDHRSALTSPAGPPIVPRFQATRQRTEQNRAWPAAGRERGAHRLAFRLITRLARVWPTEIIGWQDPSGQAHTATVVLATGPAD